jgi:O-antigen/teichoic acid export membrane protein
LRQADRIILNTLCNFGRMGIEILVALTVVPIVVRDLTRSGFGLAALAMSVFAAFQLLSNAIGRAMQRYIPLDLASGDADRVRRTFNTAMAGFCLLGIAGAVVVWSLTGWLLADADAEPAQVADARRAFAVLVVWLALGFPGFVYRRGLESIQRHDLDAGFLAIITLLRASTVITVFLLGYGSITFYIAAQLGAWTLICLLCRRSFLRLVPGAKESPRSIDRPAAGLLGAFAAVGLLVILGNILGTQGFRVFVGKRLGVNELGGLAALMMITHLVWRLIDNFTKVVTPAVSALDARGSNANIAKLLASGTKYSAMVAVSMCLVPLPAASNLVTLWLGNEFAGLEKLLFVLLIAQIPFSLSATSQFVLMGLGRLRFMGPFLFARGAGGLAAAWLYVAFIGPHLAEATGCLYAVQATGAIGLFLYACGVAGTSRWRSLAGVLGLPVLLASVGAAVVWTITGVLGKDQWWQLIVSIGAGEIVFAGLAFGVGLSREERTRLLSFLETAKSRLGLVRAGSRQNES